MAIHTEQMNRLCNDDPKEVLSQKDFLRLSAFIHAECGIKITEGKKVMIEARFQKRLRVLGMKTFGDYCAYLFSPEGMEHELHHMIDAVTTNKTDFFREPSHFEFLVNTVLPEMIASRGSGIGKKLTILECGLFDGRGALYPGHGHTRVCGERRGLRFRLVDPCHGYFNEGAGKGEASGV